jgi:restriction endonuclease S subunit
MKQSKIKNIKLDWEFIKTDGIYGKELEPDTYQLAVSNMLISSGHMFENLDKGDSIREPIAKKFDNILANPPFGIKGLKYDEFQSDLKKKYTPIKTDNAVSLFIQAIIYMLKIEGKCAVILPYEGQDLFSKTNTTLVVIREYLVKTCDLKKIICLPSGIFTNTTIKTCIFYFIKKVEGSDILETEIITGKKTKKEKGRNYKFPETYQTTNVKFYETTRINVGKENEELIKYLLVEVPIETIANNSYSLNYAEYMETKEETYSEGVVVKTLGEVCKFDIGGTPSRNKNEYYENGKNLWVSVRELNGGYIYDTKEKITDLGIQKSSVKLFAKDTILFSFKLSIGKTAIVGNPLYTNEAIAGILSRNTDLLINKYLYYYLTINDFSKIGSGIIGNGSLNKKSLEQIKIPIPPLDRQKEIVKYLDFIYEKANKTSNEKIAELKQLNEFCLSNQKKFGDNELKTIGELFKFETGKNKASECDNNGNYMFITNANNKTHSTYSIDGENLFICKINASKVVFKTKIKYYNGKCCYSSLMSRLNPIIENISLKYYYYYFNSIITQIEFFNKGVANKTLDIE